MLYCPLLPSSPASPHRHHRSSNPKIPQWETLQRASATNITNFFFSSLYLGRDHATSLQNITGKLLHLTMNTQCRCELYHVIIIIGTAGSSSPGRMAGYYRTFSLASHSLDSTSPQTQDDQRWCVVATQWSNYQTALTNRASCMYSIYRMIGVLFLEHFFFFIFFC